MRQSLITELLNHNFDTLKYTNESSDAVVNVIKSLNKVINIKPQEESAVDDLGKHIFELIGFNRYESIHIHGPTKIRYIVSGERIEANPDIAIQNEKYIFLLVQEDKSYKIPEEDYHGEVEPQLVAEMLGAFYTNGVNKQGLLDSQVIYGITMLGTYCTFYKFCITKDIMMRITNGEKCLNVLNYIDRYAIGKKNPKFMLDKDNMMKTLRCYESLRKIICNTQR